MYETKKLMNYDASLAASLLERFPRPWEALPHIKEHIFSLIAEGRLEGYEKRGEGIYIHPSAHVHPSATLMGPCIIGPGCEIRPNAFVRENVLLDPNVIIGFTSEVKNMICLEGVQIAHFNYAGDSLFGRYSHMGAGAITSNVKGDQSSVSVLWEGQRIDTGLRKFGAIVGDHAEIGCNAVLNPGSILGPACRIYPLTMVRGNVPARHILKNDLELVPLKDES